jgi:hypothetical protein
MPADLLSARFPRWILGRGEYALASLLIADVEKFDLRRLWSVYAPASLPITDVEKFGLPHRWVGYVPAKFATC